MRWAGCTQHRLRIARDLPIGAAPAGGDRPRVRLVHGELEQAEALAQSLRAEGIEEVIIPRREETVRVA